MSSLFGYSNDTEVIRTSLWGMSGWYKVPGSWRTRIIDGQVWASPNEDFSTPVYACRTNEVGYLVFQDLARDEGIILGVRTSPRPIPPLPVFTLDNGFDPALGFPYPPTEYQMFAHNAGDGPHRLTWTIPDVNIGYTLLGYSLPGPGPITDYCYWFGTVDDPTQATKSFYLPSNRATSSTWLPKTGFLWVRLPTTPELIAQAIIDPPPIVPGHAISSAGSIFATWNPGFTWTFTAWDPNANPIIGFDLYRKTEAFVTPAGTPEGNLIGSPGPTDLFFDDATAPPCFYRLIGHTPQFSFIYNDVSIGSTPIGSPLWARSILGSVPSSTIRVSGVATDSHSNTYVVGNWTYSVDFGDGSGSIPTQFSPLLGDAFILKLDPNGALLWKKLIVGNSNESISGCVVDSQDKLIVFGHFGDGQQSIQTTDFGNGPVTPYGGNAGDGFIAKYDPSGANGPTLTWLQHYSGISFPGGQQYGTPAVLDSSDNIFALAQSAFNCDFGGEGQKGGAWAFGTPTGGAADSDICLAKLNGSTGSTVWAVRHGGVSIEQPKSVALDKNGDLAICGVVQGTSTDLGGGNITASGTAYNAWVAKYHGSDGSHVWSKLYGLSGGNEAYGIACDPATGNIVVGGHNDGPINFGSGVVGQLSAGFVLILDPSGNHLYHIFIGGNIDYVSSIKISNGLAIIGGGSSTSVYFGYGPFGFQTNGLMNGFTAVMAVAGGLFTANPWVRHFGAFPATAQLGGSSIANVLFDANGHVYVVGGYTGGDLDFGGPPPTGETKSLLLPQGGTSSGYVAKYF